MQSDFDAIPSRRGTDCDKWDLYDEDVLPLWVADMDFRSPEPVIRALSARVEHGFFGYPDDYKHATDLQAAIVDWLWQRHSWRVQPADLVFLPGVITGFDLACHTLKSSRRGVLVQTPVYPPMLGAAKNTRRLPQQAQLARLEDGSYAVDWDAFESAITDKTGLFILCNPHNPTGRVFRQDELERMAEICLRRGVLLCSDEIHADLVYPAQRHIPIASLDPEIARQSITLMAPSKTFNLAGLQCSFAVIPNQSLRRRFIAAGQGLVSWVNLLGRAAAVAAYREGHDWLDQLLALPAGQPRLPLRLRPRRDAPAQHGKARGHLPRLAGLHPGGSSHRPLRLLPGESAHRPQRRAQIRSRRRGLCPPQLRLPALPARASFGANETGFKRLTWI